MSLGRCARAVPHDVPSAGTGVDRGAGAWLASGLATHVRSAT